MTSEELKNAAVSVLEKPYHTQLYLILKVGDELIMRLADIEDENTAPEIQRMFVGFVNNTIISNDNIIIRSLSVADELPMSCRMQYMNMTMKATQRNLVYSRSFP